MTYLVLLLFSALFCFDLSSPTVAALSSVFALSSSSVLCFALSSLAAATAASACDRSLPPLWPLPPLLLLLRLTAIVKCQQKYTLAKKKGHTKGRSFMTVTSSQRVVVDSLNQRLNVMKQFKKQGQASHYKIQNFDIDGGPKAADFIKDAVKKIPSLRPLCLILKVFLQQRELNEVYSGGIGSYTLLAMLIAYLQVYWRGQQRRQQFREHNLGILLMNFFDFYGHKLNTSDVGVSCNSSGTFFLKTDKGFLNAERPHLLAVEDPQAPDNDIGRSSFNYFKVRSAFSLAYSLLSDAKNIIGLGSHKSILGTIIRPDPVLLDRKGGNNGELTLSTLLAGADEPISHQFGNKNGDIYNWRTLDEESRLPREKMLGDDDSLASSTKRRASKEKRRSRKGDNGEASKSTSGVSRDSVDAKKKRRKAFKANDESFSKSLPRNWNHSH